MNTAVKIVTADGIESFLADDRQKGLLRFATAGSVDDGKSTLIGRLLYEARGVYEDQLAAMKHSVVNRASGPIDFSLLTDGLRAEREQGITIDVAYRYFATPRRKFIIADTPGHVQYTRNMATGASNADLAIILIDARHGVLPQSRRHAAIAALLGIHHIVVAVNKIDLIGYDQARFQSLETEFTQHLARLGIDHAQFIPISALEGDNVTIKSARTPWYVGPALLDHLETVPLIGATLTAPLRFAVQYVIRPDSDFRGFAGEVLSGTLSVNDRVQVLPSGRTSRVKNIVTWNGNLPQAQAGQAVTVTLADEIDVGRGDMLVHPDAQPVAARRQNAMLVWMNAEALKTGRSYLLKQTTQTIPAKVTAVEYRLDVESLSEDAAASLNMNDIGAVALETTKPLFFDPYSDNHKTGSFILIDPISNATVGAGMLRAPHPHAAGRARDAAQSLVFSDEGITPIERAARFGHKPSVLWLDQSGLASALEAALFRRGLSVYALQGADPAAVPEIVAHLYNAGFIVILAGRDGDAGLYSRLSAQLGDGLVSLKNLPDTGLQTLLGVLEARSIIPTVGHFSDAGGI
ncbi:MAG: sulfate adenylyltransferase subunit CysN [Rhizomicrobium sp.]